jgi:hypothetical protein
LKSGTRIENVTRIPVTIHTSPGWPAFAGHDIIRVSIQGRWYQSETRPVAHAPLEIGEVAPQFFEHETKRKQLFDFTAG